MVSDQASSPSSKDGIIFASTTLAAGGSYSPSFNADSLPLPGSDVAPSSHSYPLNSLGSCTPDHAADRGTMSSDHHTSIDENDIVIAYVFL